jgi:hypothetical protein
MAAFCRETACAFTTIEVVHVFAVFSARLDETPAYRTPSLLFAKPVFWIKIRSLCRRIMMMILVGTGRMQKWNHDQTPPL